MKVAQKEVKMTKPVLQKSLAKNFRPDSARLTQKPDVPILSNSLLRRIDHARHLNNQNSQIQNLPLLPILKSYESRRILSSSKSGRTNLVSARQLNSATRFNNKTPVFGKKLLKSTKISAFNNRNLSSANNSEQSQLQLTQFQAQQQPLTYTSYQGTNNSMTNENQFQKEMNPNEQKILIDDLFHNGMFNFKEKNYQSNQSLNTAQSQSNLLRSLRNDTENSSKGEIIVRPIPAKTNRYDEGISKKMNNPNIQMSNNPNVNLAPLIKNFRLNSFDFHGEFNFEKHTKNTQILKPLTDFNLKSNKKFSNKNYELAMGGGNHQSLKPLNATIVSSNKSINYLAAGILNPKQATSFNGSSHVSLNRKLDLEDFEYYDVQELFKKNNTLKSGIYRKKLSQINEESTINDGTPLTNSRWSSSLSNFSGKTVKLDDEDEWKDNEDIWSDIDEETNLPMMNANSRLSKPCELPLVA